jgi:hypothetical protein
MQYAPRLRDGVTTRHPGTTMTDINSDHPLLECSLDEPLDGMWLPRHPMDVVDPPVAVVPPRTGITPLMGVYEHYISGCRWAHRGKQFSFDYEACTDTSKRVLFAGDSHGRYVLHAFKHRLDGHSDYFNTVSERMVAMGDVALIRRKLQTAVRFITSTML